MDQLQQQWDRFTQWWVDLHFTTTQRRTLGHPAPQTVMALTRLGARVVRTDTDGAIAIRAKNHLLSIKLARSGIHIFRLG